MELNPNLLFTKIPNYRENSSRLFPANTWVFRLLHANIYPSHVIFHWIFNDSHGKCAPDSWPKDKLALINYKVWACVCLKSLEGLKI